MTAITHDQVPEHTTHHFPVVPMLPHVQLTEADPEGELDLARIFKAGALFGTPVLYLLILGLFILAAPMHPALLLAAVWPAIVGGWYLGGNIAWLVMERRQQSSGRRLAAAGSHALARPPTTRPPALVH